MKFYSELLKRTFTDYKTALEAEETEKARLAKEEKSFDVTKKELAKNIDACGEDVKKAYDEYAEAQNRVNEILEKSNAEMESIINAARERVRIAEKKRYDAISEFNRKFGTYTVSYTGEKAEEEFDKILNAFGQELSYIRLI